MNILVAEDERRHADPLLALLEKNGCNPILKATPEDVCNFVKSDNPIDIALLDLMLGKDCSVQDGIGTVLAVRQAHPFLPILLFTAHVDPESWEQARRAGATAIVQKPPAITPDYFSEVLLPKIREVAATFDALRLSDIKEALQSLSEKEFISRVLVPLLQKIGYAGVATVSHGPGEFGVDIGPFFQIGDFGERTYYGVQAKACDITANASHAANIMAVFNQADAALTKRFPDADNLPRKLDRLFVITSGRITADAKSLLLDYVQDHPGVMFLTGDRVLELLSKHGLLSVLRAEQQVKCVRIVPFLLPHTRGRKLTWPDCLAILLREHMEIGSDLAHRLIDQIMQRKRIMSTTIGKGFALPHTYNTGIGRHEIMLCGADGRFRWAHVQPARVDFAAVCLFHDSESDVTGEIRRVVASAAATHMTHARTRSQPAERLLDLTSHIEQALKGASFQVAVVEPHNSHRSAIRELMRS